MPKFSATISWLRDSWKTPDDLIDGIEEFVCSMYGRVRSRRVNELRYICIQKLQAKDNQLNPFRNVNREAVAPCRSVEQHIQRVNYHVGVGKRTSFSQQVVPDVRIGHGWHFVGAEQEPIRFKGNKIKCNTVRALISWTPNSNSLIFF